MSFNQRFLPHALSALYVLGKNSMINGSGAADSVTARQRPGKPQAQAQAERAAESKMWRML
jgi:hypothetical protein